MSENTQGQNPQAAPQFALQKIYIKDLSFESPRPVEALSKPAERADINFQFNTENQPIEDGLYEVVLTMTVTVSKERFALYLIEVKQAGIFTVKGFPAQELPFMLNSYCPNILFPYIREVVSSVVERGGFPQLLLKPVNFDAVYRQYLEHQAAQAQK
jgi:preprotein translocase subunit SecB